MRFSSDLDLYNTISQNIKYYRKQRGITQIQLAEEAKISISYLSKYRSFRIKQKPFNICFKPNS